MDLVESPAQPVVDVQTLDAIARRLQGLGFVVEGATDGLFACKREFRLSWFATSLTVYVAVRTCRRATVDEWVRLEAAAASYASSRWRGLRGFQMGYAVMPLLVAQEADDATINLVAGSMKVEWSRFTVRGLRLPGRVVESRFPRLLGAVYHPYLRGIISAVLRTGESVPATAP